MEYEIDWVEKHPKHATWELARDAYKRLLTGVETEIKWEGFKSDLDLMKAEVKAHPKSQKLAAAYGKLEAAFNARNENYLSRGVCN